MEETKDISIPLQMNLVPFAKEFAKGVNQVMEGHVSNGFNTLAKGAVNYFSSAGFEREDMADGLAMLAEAEIASKEQERKLSTFQPARPYSMIATQKKTSEIQEMITLMNNFLMCNELIFCNLEQNYAYRILDLLKEKGLYCHQLKKYTNKLRDVTGALQIRIRDSNQLATIRSCSLIMPSARYSKEFQDISGGVATKLQLAFSRMFDVKLKLIRMDSKEIAKKLELKHPDLVSEIFTLLSLAETSIELFAFCQKQIRISGRGRLIDHTIKSTHHEAVRNIARNLIDQFVSRKTVLPKEEASRAREHVKEFQVDLVKDEMFEMFNAQYMAVRIEYIEFYLASVRTDIENGTVSRGLIREVWHRLGTKQATKSFFKQLAKIPISYKEDTNAMDVAGEISSWNGKAKTLDTFRRLCAEGNYAEKPKESDDEFRCRVLRTVARMYKGELPNDVLASLVRSHGTKKAIVEQLQKAGFELKPTLIRVKKMKASELKQIA